MKTILRNAALLVGLAMAVVTCKSCKPIKNFTDSDLRKEPGFCRSPHQIRTGNQTAVLIADVNGTEIFDFLAPYHILSQVDQLDVVVVSQRKSSIPLWKGLTVYPHYTLEEFQEMNLKPALVVVPNILNPGDQEILNWMVTISSQTTFLSVCEGSRVIAETGLFSDQPIATHHSSLKQQKKRYPELRWLEGRRFIQTDSLISTSGVAAAVEGSLVASAKLSDPVTSRRVSMAIQYPYDSIRATMNPKGMGLKDLVHILSKTAFKSNRHLAIYVPPGFDEFRVGAIVDTYNRTFPMSLNTFSSTSDQVVSKHGLIAVPTSKLDSLENIDEIIVPMEAARLNPVELSWLQHQAKSNKAELYFYDHDTYLFHQLFHRISAQYGNKYGETVFRLLDYDINSEL